MSAYVRNMVASDVDDVLAIEERSFAHPWSRGIFRSELCLDDRVWLVAVCSGRVSGYIGACFAEYESHILNLAVAHDWRRRGLAKALLAALYSVMSQRGVNRMTLEVREGNAGAIALCESAGFIVAGLRPQYYSESGEDALTMSSGELDSSQEATRFKALAREAESTLSMLGAFPDILGPIVLAIETSCDETAAAVLSSGSTVLSSVVASQTEFHSRFGGVVPEIASRKHTEAIVSTVDEAMKLASERIGVQLAYKDLDAIAVTQGPGLVGALVVGLAYAKGLSLASGVPMVGVNHLEGHIFAARMADSEIEPPFIALVLSGGHTFLAYVPKWGTYKILGETLDDAVGEAFDKVAKLLGLGYPGGPILSALAEEGDRDAIDFPRAMMHSKNYSFSLSGLKTAVVNYVRHEREAGRQLNLPDLAASFQAAVNDVQVAKTLRAVKKYDVKRFVLGGGVAANRELRHALSEELGRAGVSVSVPPLALCTDNAVMIGVAGTFRFLRGERLLLSADVMPDMRLG
ncbi:MAG: tRNA (adenosine(37)-N6)-threonylcarbamoyltransferase complex transferase subunit TsaD [Actinobacteria bacterium]|nr:tRNA (adenosine(37)-N6)-threonylcarbamoyltransferase complex transferase subunit TsaD [Actinomycetota bacterium]